ncbi:MAG: DegV family EDD domain-containing protein [Acetatifactor sp.]|nr:DegV family EDD domain-containing protein [Acetatifactor sp.]
MLKKWISKQLDAEVGLRERWFRLIIMLGMAAIGFNIIAGVFQGQSIPVLGVLLGFLAVMSFALWSSVKHGRFNRFSLILIILANGVFFPAMFFLNGGVEGDVSVWFVVGVTLVFIMFRGKKMLALVIYSLLAICATYVLGYFFPEWIQPIEGRGSTLFDSATAAVLASILIGLLIKMQNAIYEREVQVTEEQKAQIEEISRAQSTFFANMSHEIRTPINTIIGLNEMTLREEISDEIAENSINIQNASKMLLTLINDILDLSKLESGKMEIVPTRYETGAMFSDLVNIIWVRAHQKELEFKIDISPEIPSMLYGDEVRLKQVLTNILTNAVKYTEIGSVTLRAKAERNSANSVRLRISVEDTGMGIKKDDLDQLFDSFKRVDEEKNRKVEGTGLGLAISKQLVEMMGGTITVDSIYTKGSTFTVILEQQIMDEKPIGSLDLMIKKKIANRDKYRQTFEAPDARVLVVDDNDMNLMVATKLLRGTKVQVDTASSGEECLEKTKGRFYHVIFMDHMMPGMDGVETLRRLRKQQEGLCQDVPVIALTANALSGAEEIYQNSGFQSYLAKPINGALLEATLLKYLPAELIEYSGKEEEQSEEVIQQVMGTRKRKVAVSADCVCDLPQEWLDRFEITTMYYYIYTDQGRFSDGKEITADNIIPYLQNGGGTVRSEHAPVEEYESLFANTLEKAEQVIHITMGKNSSSCYAAAEEAAKGFDNVHVVDSGHLSSGMGILVLYAAKLAQTNLTVDEILKATEDMKARISTSFVVTDPEMLYRNGKIGRSVTAICKLFSLRPVLYMHQSKIKLQTVIIGSPEKAYQKYIKMQLKNINQLDSKVCFLTHAGFSVKQQNEFMQQVKEYQYFERVFLQKASATIISNCGLGTFGVLFMRQW